VLRAGLAVHVGALAIAVEDRDEFGRAVDGSRGVGGHRRELGCLAGLDDHLAIAERQQHPPFDHEEPVVSGVDSRGGGFVGGLEPHLDRDGAAGGSAQHPRGPIARAARRRPDDDVVVVVRCEQGLEIDVERPGERQEHVEADRAFAGLDAADRRGAQVGRRRHVVEREPEAGPQASQSAAHCVLDRRLLIHHRSLVANTASHCAASGSHRIVGPMTDHRPRTIERHCDVAIIGGSAAGLAAALQLGRQRRSAIVIDAGAPRNAPAAHMHGYLGFDGRAPGDLTAAGRDEVRSHGGEICAGQVLDVTRDGDGHFRVHLTGGHSIIARRVLAASGLVDELPDVDGVAGHWGRDVVHCPFCHGYEVRDRRLVHIVNHPMGLHAAALMRHLTDRSTVVVPEGVAVDSDELERLRASGVEVRIGQVRRLVEDDDGGIVAVELADGQRLAADVVMIGTRLRARAEPLASLGVVPVEHPAGIGDVVEIDATGRTTVPGLYAAGNITDPSHQVAQAAAHGAWVGAMIAFSLAHDDMAAKTRPSANEIDWDHRYSGEQMWSGNPNGTLVNQVAGLVRGRALDVGAGEGGDAVWLAEQGWQVTANDVSAHALARVEAEARRRGLTIATNHADANALDPFAGDTFDLVSAHYASIPRTPDRRAVHHLLDAVAPGGVLLVVSHDLEPMRGPIDVSRASRAFDPDAYVRVEDVVAALADAPGWQIEVNATRPRPSGAVSGHHVDDVVLQARRRPH
jgi:thioredoxin reductase/SAM-dependent methyltransferase